MADADDVDNRSKCFEFCSENRIEQKGSCCGLIFENTIETGSTKTMCALYFAELTVMPPSKFEGGFYYYTSIPLGDGLRAKLQDIAALFQDTKDDWIDKSAQKVVMATASVMIIGSYIWNK